MGRDMHEDTTLITAAESMDYLRSDEGCTDPYPAYAWLRRHAPVYFDEAQQTYFLTRFWDCRDAVGSPLVTVPDHRWHDQVMPGWRDHAAAAWAFTCMALQPPAAHAQTRHRVNRVFTPRTLDSLESSTHRLVRGMLDSVERQVRDGAVVDIQDAIGFPLPVAVIGNLLGVPSCDWPQFRWEFTRILRVMEIDVDAETLAHADAAMLRVYAYFTDLLRERRTQPEDDLISSLLGDPDGLPDDEILSLVVLLFTAGFETTTLTIGTATYALLTNPSQGELVRADRTLAAAAAEEVIRWDCAVQRVTRVTAQPMELGGTRIPGGATVAPLLGAANRDPAVYDAADRFDIRRSGPRSLAFGGGPYTCLGYALAKQEVEIFIGEFTARFPDLRLGGEPVRRTGPLLRGFDSVPVAAERANVW
jgi:cytochrome P450